MKERRAVIIQIPPSVWLKRRKRSIGCFMLQGNLKKESVNCGYKKKHQEKEKKMKESGYLRKSRGKMRDEGEDNQEDRF